MTQPARTFRSELSRIRSLGAARAGVDHWWLQRLTAVLLVPLTVWFVAELVAHTGADHAAVIAWLGSPLRLGLMTLLIGATFYHAQLGVQVVIEDYIQGEGLRIALIVLVKLACLTLAIAAIVALMSIAFRG